MLIFVSDFNLDDIKIERKETKQLLLFIFQIIIYAGRSRNNAKHL